MTKREILATPSIAYYSGFDGLEIKKFEDGVDDNDHHVIFVTGCWHGGPKAKRPHMRKVYYDSNGDEYFKYNGYKVLLKDCVSII